MQPLWSVRDDPDTGGLIATLPHYISAEISAAVSEELARQLRERGKPTVVVADLYDVEEQDIIAPLVSMKALSGVAQLIKRVDIIVRRQTIRLAIVTACHTLGLSFTLRAER